jgi:transketolase
MRTAFIESLCDVAAADERVWLLTADLGYSVVERFAERFPGRYLNVGIAEQNLIGVAAGLAACGAVPFVYSIANFPTLRCLEQIRNDVCYHKATVKIVAVGGGLSYGPQGYTHHGCEDLAVMRVLPHMTVVAPGDPVEARLATSALAAAAGPGYLRLGKGGESAAHAAEPQFVLGRALRLREGGDVTLASTGAVLPLALGAADRLAERGVAATVLSVHTLAPVDRDALLAAAHATGWLITIEEHGLGGLGTVAAEVLAEAAAGARFTPLRLRREPLPVVGDAAYLRDRHGLNVERIVACVCESLLSGGR